MSKKLLYLGLFFALGTMTACIGEDNSAPGTDTEDSGVINDGSSDDRDVVDQDGGNDASEEDDASAPRCGDGKRNQASEECDDGNFFEDDGCTSLCEYTCFSDDECDDDNLCNGQETCDQAEHKCKKGAYAKDGADCAPLKSCFAGLCLDDVCGDKLTTDGLGEKCDDGNTDDTDGCTRKCEYSCISDQDCEASDPCSGAAACNLVDHVCGGDPRADQDLCVKNGMAGWCINGACVPTDCGNGTKEGEEECDEGTENGKPGSLCAASCKNVICGNGTVEGKEQCDDGNTLSLDGCDAKCKTEIFVRWTNMNLLRDPAPEWCKHPGRNRFAEAFADKVDIDVLGTKMSIDVLDGMINKGMSDMFTDCSANPILQIFDLDDPTFKTSDDDVRLTSYNGTLGPNETCGQPAMAIDTGFYLTGTNIDENRHPIRTVEVVQRPGIIKTEESVDLAGLEGSADSRVGALKHFMMLLPVDTTILSTPEGSDKSVKVPEKFGFNDPSTNPYRPKGLVCAAMDTSGIAKAPMTSDTQRGGICCKSTGGTYDPCLEGEKPGADCNSQLDLFRYGCKICLSATFSIDCSNCANGIEIIRPIEMDVDTNNDGQNDAYSIVVAIEGERVHALGIQKK